MVETQGRQVTFVFLYTKTEGIKTDEKLLNLLGFCEKMAIVSHSVFGRLTENTRMKEK